MRGVPSILVSVKRHPVARWIAAIAAALTALGGMGAGVAFLLDASNQVAQELVATTPGSGVNGDQLGGFGPARESYDYSVAPRECVRGVIRHDRCGSMDRAVFNSFINIPSYGDERAFFDGRDRASPLHNGDPIEGVAPDDQLTLRTFINNDANDERAGGRCDDQARGVARNTRISLQASPDVALQTVVRATIAAANAASVYDDVTVRSATPFLLAYVPGSAELLRDNRHVRLSDDIATPEGALVGWHEMDGTFPGCFDAAALVEARFVVVRAG